MINNRSKFITICLYNPSLPSHLAENVGPSLSDEFAIDQGRSRKTPDLVHPPRTHDYSIRGYTKSPDKISKSWG